MLLTRPLHLLGYALLFVTNTLRHAHAGNFLIVLALGCDGLSVEAPDDGEVLRLLAAGFSNREIGTALHVAEGTIKNHVSNILGKMGVRDRTRAVLKAAGRGFL